MIRPKDLRLGLPATLVEAFFVHLEGKRASEAQRHLSTQVVIGAEKWKGGAFQV